MELAVKLLAIACPILFCAGYWFGAAMQREQCELDGERDLDSARREARREVAEEVRDVMRREHFDWHGAPVTAWRHLSPVLARHTTTDQDVTP